MGILYEGLGTIFNFIYNNISPNYGITIILFTLLVKSLLLPFAIKQQKSMVDMQRIQPHLEEIRNKYKNDMQKMNEETMKLYSEHKVNPLGGCLPALVQLPIFIALYGVITQPLKYIFKFTENQLYGINYVLNLIVGEVKSQINMIEYSKTIVNSINAGSDIISLITAKIQDIPNFGLLLESLKNHGYNASNISEIAKLISDANNLNMNFLGLDLAQFPNANIFGPLILIPLLAGLTTYFSSLLSMKISKTTQTNSSNDMANSMQSSMMTMMPIMSVIFTYSMPAGLGIYWIFSNIIQIVQQYFLNKFIPREGQIKK